MAVIERLFVVVFFAGASGGLSFINFYLPAQQVEQLVWFAAYGFVLAVLATRPRQFADHVVTNAVFLTWPAVAILSTLWSLQPGPSLLHGLQFLMTVLVGLALSHRFTLPALVRLLFWGLLATAAASALAVALDLPFALFFNGEWRGVFPHKNMLGGQMLILVYTSLILAATGWRRTLTVPAAAAAIALLLGSESGTAFALLVIVLLAIPVLLLRYAEMRIAGLAFSFGGCAAVAAAAMLVFADVDPLRAVLEALGKDETLTGRTTLWQFGWASFQENPLLGVGYKAYWDAPASTGTYLRQIMGQELWHFHNNVVEVAVATGLLGLAVLLWVLLRVAIGTVRAFLTEPSATYAWPLLLLLSLSVRMLVENPLFLNHNTDQVLLVVVGAAVGHRLRAPAGAVPGMFAAPVAAAAGRAAHRPIPPSG